MPMWSGVVSFWKLAFYHFYARTNLYTLGQLELELELEMSIIERKIKIKIKMKLKLKQHLGIVYTRLIRGFTYLLKHSSTPTLVS